MAEPTTFLLELYVPRADCDAVTIGAARLSHAAAALAAEGRAVRVVRTIFVPEDETCYVLVEAATVDEVNAVAKQASLSVERVVATARPLNDERTHS